ncbi:membrane protein [Corynebacterium aquilae DSM 44791]|uniref:Membrane protein n=1 Tax=Corynebacterium aquilae DSM 44791 TaxID=1431546 RepID=A0A1L7CGP6_9CORY|nr:DUF2631 domain-containing protein [Corynebacterium aquilae]APT84994.1 membrane protein [Corynebacterium aquilae DSM 44791]
MAGSHAPVPEIHNGVSTLDEPSAAWGWHGLSRSAVQKAGWVSVLFLLAYNFGNHHGHVETIWLFALAALVAIGLLLQLFQPKLSQVRTVTSHNKPSGHQEPDWAYLQKSLQGPYAELNDAQLRSLNIDPATVEGRKAIH